MKLSQDQQLAVDQVLAWLRGSVPTLTLGGHAGTGKSTVISHLLRTLGRSNVAVCAFTGKAASVLRDKGVDDACTMHRLIYSPEQTCLACDLPADDGVCPRCESGDHVKVKFRRVPLIDAELVIVDEASMLNKGLVRDLESFSVPILYVGDHGQLEPIGDDPGIMSDPDIRLEQVHRQAEGSKILQFAHLVRRGEHPATWTEDGDVVVRLGIRDADLTSYDALLCGYNRTRVAINSRIRELRGFSGDPKTGERLICLQNDSELGIFNGMLLTVTEIRAHLKDRLVMDFEDATGQRWTNVPVTRSQFGLERKDERTSPGIGCFDYGYAMTTHKSQGSEWERVAVLEQIAPSWMASRWRYTAATRASKTLHYFLSERG